MEFSADQDRAATAINRWFTSSSDQVFILHGPAGTGKTTIVGEIASGIEGEVLALAYTGKAASVLRAHGFPKATTCHAAAYTPQEKSRQTLIALESRLREVLKSDPESPEIDKLREDVRIESKRLAQPSFSLNEESKIRDASLVLIDELSQIDDKLGADMLSFGTKILAIGDPFQLPPVRGVSSFATAEPDAILTEIHRQARGNPIIELSRIIREENRLPFGDVDGDAGFGSARVIPAGTMSPEEAATADQFICGRNVTRNQLNKWLRRHRITNGDKSVDVPILPVDGDRLVCLKNDHVKGLMNGAIFLATDDATSGTDDDSYFVDVTPEDRPDADDMTIEAWVAPLVGSNDLDRMFWAERRERNEFDWGYALTCHKAQGSQWDKVFVRDESHCFRRDRWKWLYTAVTRPVTDLVVSADERR